MKQAFAILCSASLVLAIGCSDYDIRMGKTFEEMKYQKRLDDNLAVAPTKTSLQQNSIYLRPPKGLVASQAFSMAPVEVGRFDVETSFNESEKQAFLHVLARIKKPKAAGSKKAEPPPRGKFVDDVLELVKAAYNVDPVPALKPEVKTHANRSNTYKGTKLELEAKEVQIFIYGEPNGTHEVALIFEYPKKEVSYMSPKIGLCLESFAVGELATRAFSGGGDLDAGEDGGGGLPPPI
jgi:hypothetical protein